MKGIFYLYYLIEISLVVILDEICLDNSQIDFVIQQKIKYTQMITRCLTLKGQKFAFFKLMRFTQH